MEIRLKMKKITIYEIQGLYRDKFRVTGYEFGEGEKSVCIVGSMRGNEVHGGGGKTCAGA